jgi:hypothetical protein
MGINDFEHFLSPGNFIARILLVHFLAIEIIIAPIQEREFGSRSRILPTNFHLNWIPKAYTEFPLHLRHFLEWPNSIAADMSGASITQYNYINLLRTSQDLPALEKPDSHDYIY